MKLSNLININIYVLFYPWLEQVVLVIGAQGSKKDCELPLTNVKSSVTVLRHSESHLLYGDNVPSTCD